MSPSEHLCVVCVTINKNHALAKELISVRNRPSPSWVRHCEYWCSFDNKAFLYSLWPSTSGSDVACSSVCFNKWTGSDMAIFRTSFSCRWASCFCEGSKSGSFLGEFAIPHMPTFLALHKSFVSYKNLSKSSAAKSPTSLLDIVWALRFDIVKLHTFSFDLATGVWGLRVCWGDVPIQALRVEVRTRHWLSVTWSPIGVTGRSLLRRTGAVIARPWPLSLRLCLWA